MPPYAIIDDDDEGDMDGDMDWEDWHGPIYRLHSYNVDETVEELASLWWDCDADPDVRDDLGRTALHVLLLRLDHNDIDGEAILRVTATLIELGADPSVKDDYGETALDILLQMEDQVLDEDVKIAIFLLLFSRLQELYHDAFLIL